MADQLDNRPVFTIVMGCNGAGKSAWKRANRGRLPERYCDAAVGGSLLRDLVTRRLPTDRTLLCT